MLMHDIIVKTEHSLIVQSKYAKKRDDPVNGDGFGLGWYPTFDDPKPGVYKSIEPAWNNCNLYFVSSKIKSRLFFGHVRDASADFPVSQTNCHPFQYGHFLWMHNGFLESFNKMKRLVINHLSDRAFLTIRGNTDSEYAFALFLDEIDFNDNATNQQIRTAMMAVIEKLTYLRIKAGIKTNAQTNFAVSNGEMICVTRFSTISGERPASLYYIQGSPVKKDNSSVEIAPTISKDNQAVIIASEPLSTSGEHWQKIPRNHQIEVTIDGQLAISPLLSVDF